jgi:hypothetical protein
VISAFYNLPILIYSFLFPDFSQPTQYFFSFQRIKTNTSVSKMPTTSSEELKDTQRGEAPSAPTSNKDALNPSCRIRNDQKWNSIKEEVYRIYITEDNTLRSTMRAVSEQHAFNARYVHIPWATTVEVLMMKDSERKWKGKLKDWNFDKNISAHGMSIVLAKAQKRSKNEGKETAIFHGGAQITRERVEQFKRRKTTKDADAVSPSAGACNCTIHMLQRIKTLT